MNVGSAMKEVVRRNRKAMNSYANIMPKFRRCIITGFRISQRYYGGEEENVAGTGEGKSFQTMCVRMHLA